MIEVEVLMTVTTPPEPPNDVELVTSAERVVAGTEWFRSGGIRIRRQIVSETRTVEITVRREELVVETAGVTERGGSYVGTATDGPAVAGSDGADNAPLVLVLHEEVPEVITRVRPYERVTVSTVRVDSAVDVEQTVRHEAVEATGDHLG